MDKDEKNFKVVLSINEKIICLEEIVSKLKKVLYVYDKMTPQLFSAESYTFTIIYV